MWKIGAEGYSTLSLETYMNNPLKKLSPFQYLSFTHSEKMSQILSEWSQSAKNDQRQIIWVYWAGDKRYKDSWKCYKLFSCPLDAKINNSISVIIFGRKNLAIAHRVNFY